MKAIQIEAVGAPEVLQWQDIPELPEPAAGQARVKLFAAGLNYIDVYLRSGTYLHNFPLPTIPGLEGAGFVEAIGSGVETVKPGDRVAYYGVLGSYAEAINVPVDRLVPLPNDISFEQGAAFPLQGVTAQYLLHDYVALKPGTSVLIHAAAGGLGLLCVQWAKHLGAQVIGTVSTEAKAQAAYAVGADHVILYTQQDFVAETRRFTEGRGVDLVLDGVGKATFAGSLQVAATDGTVVSYGWSSGRPDLIAPTDLIGRSRRVAGADLANKAPTREILLQRANAVLEGIQAGWLQLQIDRVLPLSKAAKAHQLLESRASIGKILLKTHT
ncbi:MAG: quinone oxidoreductase [Stenomitos rutilans HA7619-LM2]|jgi:NADPH2:quinone reductase|nr:quinone oxidoreductase [Stenomitos rutilans HA7619-LM2]